MKLCFFDFTINFVGGPQGSLYLMKRLQDAGHECHVIDAYGYSKPYKNTAILYNLKYQTQDVTLGNGTVSRAINLLKQSPTLSILSILLIKHLKKIKPDVVFLNNKKSLIFAYLAKRFLNFKMVLYFRGEGNKAQLSTRFINLINYTVDYTIAHLKVAVENLAKAGVKISIK